jgi:hypothetical protein
VDVNADIYHNRRQTYSRMKIFAHKLLWDSVGYFFGQTLVVYVEQLHGPAQKRESVHMIGSGWDLHV